MEKVFQVFVSSTYADLTDERRHVSETLAKAGYIPAGMELFPATDQQQLEFIKRVIDRCDYYVVIVGGRYGSLADENISFTEKEYEYAVEKRIPVLAFLHRHPDKIEVGKTDRNEEQSKRLISFRDRLSRGRIVDFWSEPQELCTKVVIAVTQSINLTPGVGWVRGDQAIDPKILQELEQQRVKNAELERQLELINSVVVTFSPNLPPPDDEIVLRVYAGSNASSPERAQYKLEYKTTWSEIFLKTIDLILNEQPELYIGFSIAEYLVLRGNTGLKSGQLHIEDLRKIRFQFEALGLIRTTVKQQQQQGGGSYSMTVWQITNKGRRFMSERLALQRQQAQ
jgi:hypothetical protein